VPTRNLFFYKKDRGEAVTGTLVDRDFSSNKRYEDIGKWDHGACIDGLGAILLYEERSAATRLGNLTETGFQVVGPISGISSGWTHIVDIGLRDNTEALPLFYSSASGHAAIGFSPTVKEIAFNSGWDRIVSTNSGVLFYQESSGAAAVCQQRWTDLPPMVFDLVTVADYAPGQFALGWSQIASNGTDIVFYNKSDGSVTLGRLVGPSLAFETKNSLPGVLDSGYTHVVGTQDSPHFLFYNSDTGAYAIGDVFADGGGFAVTRSFPADAMSRGWDIMLAGRTAPNAPPG
jgi:hypothetical protein